MLELTALRHFRAVAEARNFSRAAEKLFVTQPAVSHQIRLLERTLGVRLFERTRGAVELTEAGRTLDEFCLDLFARLTEAETRVRNLQQKVEGPIACASPAGITDGWLVPELVKFQKQHPAIDYRIVTAADETVRQLVLDRRVDFGIVLERVQVPGSALLHVPVFEEEYVLVVPGSPGRKRPPPMAGDVVFSRSFVIVEESDFMLERWLAVNYPGRAKEIRVRHVANHIPAILAMVQAGLGVAVLPRHSVARAIRSGRLAEVVPPASNVRNRFVLAYREQEPMPLKLRSIVGHLAAAGRALGLE